jgi:hypothetical protein
MVFGIKIKLSFSLAVNLFPTIVLNSEKPIWLLFRIGFLLGTGYFGSAYFLGMLRLMLVRHKTYLSTCVIVRGSRGI